MNRLEDKVAIITGATGGIGEATVDLFIKEGANVLMVDLSEDELISVSNKIGSNKLSYFQGDVTNASDNQRAVELAVERYGGLDIFVANAGVSGDVSSITEYNEEVFDQVMSVNAKGPFLGLQGSYSFYD
jgi:NADP-dependent 3-hydroxy acid dehydrogenase YdfG